MWNPISASTEQIKKIYNKYLRLPIFFLTYDWDGEDNIGFVSFYTWRGDRVEYQMRRHKPCFIEFQPIFGGIRYDIDDLEEGKLLQRLTKLGLKAEKSFWRGAQL